VLEKKSVLITGTSSGIGNALAREFNAKGYNVLATARRADSIQDLKDLGITPLSVDVDSPESIAALRKEVEALTGGKLDMLINNAGRRCTMPAVDLDIDDVEACFRTNVFGVMRMCKAFAPLVIAAKGTIVQIGSIAGVMPYVFGSAYNASKAALHAYSNTLRVEMAPFDVKVVTFVTGGVVSGLTRADVKLPADSIYLPINAAFERRSGYSQEVGMPTEKYARSVVSQLLPRRPKSLIWQGTGSTLVWIASTFLPYWVMDYYFSWQFNLRGLRKSNLAKKNV